MSEPDYDMTEAQFEELKQQLKEELDEKIEQIRNSDNEGDEGENDDEEAETEFKIVLSEVIPVKVLLSMDNESIETKDL